MSAAKHTSSRDPSFRRSLLRNVAGAVGLVVGVAAIFGVLGMIGRADPDPSSDVADGSDEPAGEPETEAPADETPDGPADEAAGGSEGTGQEAADEDSEDGEAAGAEDGEDDAAEDAEDDESSDEAPAEEPPAEEEPATEPRIDPSTISVQVLDGYREDGGTAADAVFEQLQSAGYNIIARNPAIAYEVTTVLWTEGFEAEGRQVAQEIGAAEVRQQPGNLSNEVNVHVVVGADRG